MLRIHCEASLRPLRPLCRARFHGFDSAKSTKGSTRQRLLLALAAVSATAVLLPSSALANGQGGWVVGSSSCPSSNCRATRSDITQSLTAWNVPSTTFGYEWIAVQNTTSACPYFGGCIVQVGYAKYTSSGAPANCTGSDNSTGGNVKMLYYAIYSDGTLKCHLGQAISANENHSLKVARCNSSGSDWCSYRDGTLEETYTSPGVGSTAPQAAVIGEFGCDTCMNANTFIGSKWGAGTVGTYNWQVGDNTFWNTVTSSETSIIDHPICNEAGDPKWIIDSVNTSAQWSIHWENGGVSC